ncbi:hypothetical protein ACO0QE_002397 [Hanseniaspora vineae]
MSANTFLKNGPMFPTTTQLDHKIEPLSFLLADGATTATAFSIYDINEVPESLVNYMYANFSKEVQDGLTYPSYDITLEEFRGYWFFSFCAIVLKGKLELLDPKQDHDADYWDENFLGTFYVKPNYPGRCSHNCNAGFFIPHSQRGKKLGRKLGQLYLKIAPQLGYAYSVFNLVFVSNPASWRIWDKLNFQRLGLVPNVAVLGEDQKAVTNNEDSREYKKTDAIIFGKDLTSVEAELFDDFVQV